MYTYEHCQVMCCPKLNTLRINASKYLHHHLPVYKYSCIRASIVLSNSAPVCFCGVLRLTDLLFCNWNSEGLCFERGAFVVIMGPCHSVALFL